MNLPGKSMIENAAARVRSVFGPTPQYAWPLLSARIGTEVWVKHENHTPIGAFKIRGGLAYMDSVEADTVIAATRGNHGQSIAMAAGLAGKRTVIAVPECNSREKNAAMKAFGAELVVHGEDFQDAYDYVRERAARDEFHLVPSFHELLVAGVATYSVEFLSAVPDLDVVYVPIGLGSGICGAVSARELLGKTTEIVGVVAEQAPAYALSFLARHPVSTNSAETIADGVACRQVDPAALEVILTHVARVVTVSEAEIRNAMRWYFMDTHNVVEGAGAAPLAALMKEREAAKGKTVGIVASGGNVDTDVFCRVLAAGEES